MKENTIENKLKDGINLDLTIKMTPGGEFCVYERKFENQPYRVFFDYSLDACVQEVISLHIKDLSNELAIANYSRNLQIKE